ncbi:GMC family oxidoreductase [Streptomyces sp. NPDC005648]|uniref:GMC family oxidoreductase n=1 Tax=Streptomyces sp. NPDC005648 TaxID=3157044 RepID=UPI0033BEE54E
MAQSHAEHVHTVIVGSGFGGSVAAYRLAAAGQQVVLLERGRAYPPGGFARSPAEMGRAFWDPKAGLHGLFDVWSFRAFDSVVASGLGGGSLIYASVLLRKDERWFVEEQPLPGGGYEAWPVGRAELDPHYDEVERMLRPVPYPLDRPGYTDTPRAHAMREAAQRLGLTAERPPLAISFAPQPGADPGPGLPLADIDGGNLHGVGRRTCRLCGECNLGCNDGAKNSLDHTYLSAARRHGADLRTGHEVRAVRALARGGYAVDYVRHGPDEEKTESRMLRTISCDRLVLAAGTYNTVSLLLRSRRNLPGLSPAIGSRFSTNGDHLAFVLRARQGTTPRPMRPSRGPVITSSIRLPDELDGVPDAGRGGYIQDAGYPGFVEWLVEGAHAPQGVSRAARFLTGRLLDRISHAPDPSLSGAFAELLGDGAFTGTSLPLLAMGRDVPDGELRMRGGLLDCTWTVQDGSAAQFERTRGIMRQIAGALGGGYADHPLWHRHRVLTVHPLGGAPIGRHPGTGVCDPYGEVFGHPGLYVADGAAMPGPVGPNPALTIAALADRMCTRLLEHAPAAPPAVAHRTYPRRTSLQFTEELRGRYAPAAEESRTEPFAFRLTVTADDVDAFLEEPSHEARADGWIDSPSFGGRRPVLHGSVRLFADGCRTMRYRLHFTDADGLPRTFTGRKDLAPGAPARLWTDTTRLTFRVLNGHVHEPDGTDAALLGTGTAHLGATDLARLLTTFRTTGPDGTAALTRFGRFFAGELWNTYALRRH